MERQRIRTLLVANRGEIARRVFRSARDMGISTVAIYSEPDRRSPHVRDADVAIPISGSTALESYLDIGKILDAARSSGADAVHPGYGFLAESPEFATACRNAGLTWVGPPPEAIAAMALKVEAKRIVGASGVPLLPGATVTGDDEATWVGQGEAVGYPLIVKASAGGGGKGMHRVDAAVGLVAAIRAGRREAASAFGDPTVFLERFLVSPRHVEVQLFADEHGSVVHLFERDCSLQRRHQKVIEEARAPRLPDSIVNTLHEAAIQAATAIGYVNAGTVEFLVSGEQCYFLEMNTRLQVEHPVTEEIIGLDLVRLQLQVASGEPLGFEQSEIRSVGHSIEARLYAEDASRDFMPSVGTIHRFGHADSPGVRWETGVETGSEVSPFYDPMLAKIVAHARTRDEAAARLVSALRDLQVHGVTTNRDALVASLEHESFLDGDVSTMFFEEHPEVLSPRPESHVRKLHAVGASLVLQHRRIRAAARPDFATPGWRNVVSSSGVDRFRVVGDDPAVQTEVHVAITHASNRAPMLVEVDGDSVVCDALAVDEHEVDLEFAGQRRTCEVWSVDDRHWVNGAGWQTELLELPRFSASDSEAVGTGLTAPLPGTVIVVEIESGQHVEIGQLLVVIEAMKMEHRIVADVSGIVDLRVAVGDRVDAHQVLVAITRVDEGD